MSNLVAFLNARLREDEAAAKAAGSRRWRGTEAGSWHEFAASQATPPKPPRGTSLVMTQRECCVRSRRKGDP